MARLSAVPSVLALLFALAMNLQPVAAAGSDDDFSRSDFDPIVIILFMFFGLCLGVFTMQILSRVGESIPYTVVIFSLGAIFSTVIRAHDTGAFGESIKAWANIDAELMLFIFLPPLIFGEAMNLNWHHILGALKQSTLLAGPGVLIGAALMGVICKFILPYNWGWDMAMVFGSILSATDPVAVVALLKSAGASPKLTMLIVGESLLNDGTAMVLFTLFFKILEGYSFSASDIIAFFFEAALGSVVFGAIVGLVIVRWLRSANRPLKEEDATIQIAITICSGYLIFFFAQYSMEVSGVLACCGAGAMISWLGPPIIISRESMHNVWVIIEWMGNTLIFLLAGLIIGQRSLAHVRAIDWLYAFILFVILMAIRAFIVVLLFPWLKCTVNEGIFISWAGLRGALSMALALIVENSSAKDVDHTEASRLFFYVGMIAAFTLIFNATTAKSMLLYLKLIDDNAIEKELVVEQIKKRLSKKMEKIIHQMSAELKPQEIEEVRMSCSLLRDSQFGMEKGSFLGADMEQGASGSFYSNSDKTRSSQANDSYGMRPTEDSFLGKLNFGAGAGNSLFEHSHQVDLTPSAPFKSTAAGGARRRSRASSRSKSFVEADLDARLSNVSRMLSMANRGPNSVIIPDLLAYIRGIFLEIVRVKYWQHIESGKLPRLSHSAQFLLYSVDVGIDMVRSDSLQDWQVIQNHIQSTPWYLRSLTFLDSKLPKWHWLTYQLGKLESRREKRIVYILTSFIDAHMHAQSKIHEFLGRDEDELEDMLSTPEEIQIKAESEAAVAIAKNLLENLPQETVAAIKSKQIARTVLAQQAELVKSMVEEGLLTAKHAEEFLEEIREDADNIEKERQRMYQQVAADSAQKKIQRKFDIKAIIKRGSKQSPDALQSLVDDKDEENSLGTPLIK